MGEMNLLVCLIATSGYGSEFLTMRPVHEKIDGSQVAERLLAQEDYHIYRTFEEISQ
jgi:hypothetical protein